MSRDILGLIKFIENLQKSNCTDCSLSQHDNHIVVARGNADSEIILVGEAPGLYEDREGIPFVGPAGQLMDKAFAAAGLDTNKDMLLSNICLCLDGQSAVLTDIGWKRIDWVVNHQYSGTVASVSLDGNIEYKPITNWFRSKLNNRKLYKLHLDHSRNNAKGDVGATLTEDHQVLTQHGYIAIKDLNSNTDRICSGTLMPSQDVQEAIYGILLGDGHGIIRSNCLYLSHSQDQEDYLRYCASLLNCDHKVIKYINKCCEKSAYRFNTYATPYLRKLLQDFYRNKKKIIPSDLRNFSIISLAYLFMDDGYMRLRSGRQPLAEIATCNFSERDVKRLASRICTLGIKCYVRKTGKYYRIFFNAISTKKLSRSISRYVHPTMRYKLIPSDREVDFVELDRHQPIFYDTFSLKEVSSVQTKYQRGRNITNHLDTVFCIEVQDNNNFLTRSGIVHNCRPVAKPGSGKQNYTPLVEQKKKCVRNILKIVSLMEPKLVIACGKVAAEALLDYKVFSMEDCGGKIYLSTRQELAGVSIYIMYHPAFILHQQKAGQEAFVKAKWNYWEQIQTLKRIIADKNIRLYRKEN